MKIIEKKTAELIPYARNPRKNDDAVNSVAASIKEFGFKQPIVIDAEGVVVAGHTRLKAAQKLELETVPCVVASDLTPAQIKAYRLLDNKVAEKADWDFALLSVELEDLADFDLEPFDIDWELPIDTTPIEDGAAAPAPPEVAFSKSGDLWLLGRHRVVCGDSRSLSCLLLALGDEPVTLCVTDPPYGVNYDPSWRPSTLGVSADGYSTGVVENDATACWGGVIEATGAPVVYHWCADIHQAAVTIDLEERGYRLVSQIIWNKSVMVLGRGDYHWKHETCLYFVKKGQPHNWQGSRKETTVWDIQNNSTAARGGEDTWGHSTQKPLDCMARPLRNNSQPGDVVCDPFLGSGTTLIAAHKLNRRCFGLEISTRYVDVICQRFYNETGIIPVKEDGTKFPVDRNGLKEKSVKDTQTQE